MCYADGVFDSQFNCYLTVREDRRESSTNPTTTIVSVDLSINNVEEHRILVEGNDFYAFPRIDHKGERWPGLNGVMPWDISELCVGYISKKGDVQNRTCVAGGDPSIVESPTEPMWSPEGRKEDHILEFWMTLRTMSLLHVPFTDVDNITSGVDCLYVEGASAVHPLSIAKVILID